MLIAKEKLGTDNDILIERDETLKANKKRTFESEKKQTGEFLLLLKRQTKHPAAIRIGTTTDMMRQYSSARFNLSLKDICDSK